MSIELPEGIVRRTVLSVTEESSNELAIKMGLPVDERESE